MVPLKYLINFCRTPEMSLMNCGIRLQLIWLKKCFIVTGTAANQQIEFKVTDAKFDVSFVTLSIQDNIKLLKQSESGFKRTIIGN